MATRSTPIRTGIQWGILRFGEVAYTITAVSFGILFFVLIGPPILLVAGLTKLVGSGWLALGILGVFLAWVYSGERPKRRWYGSR